MNTPEAESLFSVFQGSRQLAYGSLVDVALKAKRCVENDRSAMLLIFEEATGKAVDLDLRGSLDDIRRRHAALAPENDSDKKSAGPGRPRLGIVSREVTLLPRQWEWLSAQPGGASVTLRKLVEDARKKNQGRDLIRRAQEAAHRFMTAMAGDRPGFEEALRALYVKDAKKFGALVGAWPKDIQACVHRMAKPAFG